MIETAVDLTNLKKRIAYRRNRNEALSVIVPRLIGAIAHSSHKTFTAKSCIVVKEEFRVEMTAYDHAVYLELREARSGNGDAPWWVERFRCRLPPAGTGRYLSGRIDIMSWERGGHMIWQNRIFDVFKRDSHWLLDFPPIDDRPMVVRAALLEFNKGLNEPRIEI